MKAPFLIVVTGAPGTGKTTLGLRIAKDLDLPFVYKDGVKERLFDSLGWSDREWSKKLSTAAYQVLFYFAEALLSAGRSLVIEANFHPVRDTPFFIRLKEGSGCRIIQILCYAEGGILLQRFEQRGLSRRRHPGHMDEVTIHELTPELLKIYQQPLELGGQLIRVDTSNFGRIDYPNLISTLLQAVKE